MADEKILIVGGSGYIGGAITDILLEEKSDFLVYDNLTYERDFRKPVPFIFGDVLDTAKLKEVITDYNPTSVIWLAAMVGDGACKVNPEHSIKLNQDSVKWISQNYDGRIVFTSSCSVYGQGDDILTEDSPKNPLSLYAVTKLKSEEFLRQKNAVIFRLGTLFGVSDCYSRIRSDLVVNILSLKAAIGKPLTVYGGDQWRPLLHVRDAASAILGAALTKQKGKLIPSGIYNLSNQNMTIKQIAQEIVESFDGEEKPTISYLDIKFEDERNYRVSNEKYLSLKGAIKPVISVKEGAKEIIGLVRHGRIKNPFDPNYSNEHFVKEIMSQK